MSGFEVVGAIAAAGQFVEQSLKIGLLIKSIYDQVQDTPEEIQRRFARLETLRANAQRIQDAPSLQTAEAKAILSRCNILAQSLWSELEKITITRDDSLGRKTWRAILGVEKEEKILGLFTEIDQEQASLVLHISTLNSEVSHLMQETLQTGLSSIGATLKNIQDATPLGPDATRCTKALFITDPAIDRESLKSAKGCVLTGTCDWILERSEFCQWQAAGAGPLWISGGPGMGKTMLSIYLTEQFEMALRSEPQVSREAITYFFCDLKDNRRNSAVSILRGLMFHLIQFDSRLTNHLLPRYQIQGDQLFQDGSFEVLWKAFFNMVSDTTIGRVTCIIDGLDECEPASLDLLLSKLKQISWHASKLRTILVSREHPKCLETSLSQFPRIRLDPDAKDDVNSGLEQYIATRVTGLSRDGNWTPKLTAYVKDSLKKGSGGTYLWVSFVIKDLRSMEVSEVEAHLEQLPQFLGAYYERMLHHVDLDKRTWVCDILRWCTFAVRPLRLDELSEALGLQQTDSLSREEVLRGKLAYCGHFLAISEGHPRDPERTVGLVHQSAYDFLTQRHEPDKPLPWFSFDVEQQHAKLASSCLRFLSDAGHVEGYPTPNGSRLTIGFFWYTAEYWPRHFRLSGSHGTRILDEHSDFFSAKSQVFNDWLAYSSIRADGSASLLFVAAEFGLYAMMSEVLNGRLRRGWKRIFHVPTRIRINARDDGGRTLLRLPIFQRNLPMVKMLVKNKVFINAVDKRGESPLYWACMEGSREIAKYLIESGAKVEGQGSARLLCGAVSSGNFEFVKDLLKRNAIPSATAFSPVLCRGRELILKDLLDACPVSRLRNVTDNQGGGLLHMAAMDVNPAAMQLLLDRSLGLDVNQRNKRGQTPLHILVDTGSFDDTDTCTRACMQLLLEQPGIDPTLPDDRGFTPLSWALVFCDIRAAKFLVNDWSVPLPEPNRHQPLGAIHLATGTAHNEGHPGLLYFLVRELKADPNLRTYRVEGDAREHKHRFGREACYETPLSIAIKLGNSDIVGFFLKECNIDPHDTCRGCDGALPIHVAAESQKPRIVKTLVQGWGADINARDALQRTPLHRSIVRRLPREYRFMEGSFTKNGRATVRTLLELGVQVSAKDSDGRTARDFLASQKTGEYLSLRNFDELVRLYGKKDQ